MEPRLYMSPLLVYKDQRLENAFRVHHAQSRVRYDVLSGAASCLVVVYLWMFKYLPAASRADSAGGGGTSSGNSGPAWRADDWASVMFEAATRLLPPLVALSVQGATYVHVRTPIFVTLRVVRLARMVCTYIIKVRPSQLLRTCAGS